jgi:dynein light intermediate chain 2
VLDLSRPSELWFTLEKFLGIIKSRVDAVISEARLQQPNIKDDLKQQTWERIGQDHVDKDLMDPLLIPFVIIGAKYDVFQVSSVI